MACCASPHHHTTMKLYKELLTAGRPSVWKDAVHAALPLFQLLGFISAEKLQANLQSYTLLWKTTAKCSSLTLNFNKAPSSFIECKSNLSTADKCSVSAFSLLDLGHSSLEGLSQLHTLSCIPMKNCDHVDCTHTVANASNMHDLVGRTRRTLQSHGQIGRQRDNTFWTAREKQTDERNGLSASSFISLMHSKTLW